MTQTNRELSICSTCNSLKTCALQQGTSKTVHFCEEFDGQAPLTPKFDLISNLTATDLELAALAEANSVDSQKRRKLGLCYNCDKLPTCQLSKTEGGIWHCEEYV